MKRFFGGDGWLRNADLGIDGRSSGRRSVADGEDENFLASVIERDVLARLEEAELADTLGRDAAGGEVGDASGFEFETDVGDIDFAGEDGQSDGADFFHRRFGEGENDVKIVNHEIEDDIDIERARGENAKAVDFEKHRMSQDGDRGADGGIEALEVSDLRDALVLGGEVNEFVGFVKRSGERLFDEDVDAGLHEFAGDVHVMDCGSGDGRGLQLAVRGEHLRDGAESFAGEFAGDRIGAGSVGINDAEKADRLALLFEFFVDAGMVASEDACPDDGDGDGSRQRISRWPVAGEIVNQGRDASLRLKSCCVQDDLGLVPGRQQIPLCSLCSRVGMTRFVLVKRLLGFFQEGDLAGVVELVLHDAVEHVREVVALAGDAVA